MWNHRSARLWVLVFAGLLVVSAVRLVWIRISHTKDSHIRWSWKLGGEDVSINTKELAPLPSAQVSSFINLQKNLSLQEAHNMIEDLKLQVYLAEHQFTIKGVITILVKADRITRLNRSLGLLHQNFNRQFRYPIILFHEAEFRPVMRVVQQFDAAASIFFQQVELSIPEWHLRKFGPPSQWSANSTRRSCRLPLGYRHMCRFQAKLVYEQQIMRHFNYQFRLDDDSLISSPIRFDVFAVLTTGGFSYGYFEQVSDECAHDMFAVAENYTKSRGIKPTFFNKLRRDDVFFNNFEVSSLKFWRSQQYRDYMDHVDSLGGIYLHRWGDAPIKTTALSFFVPLREIYRFSNISYYHFGTLLL